MDAQLLASTSLAPVRSRLPDAGNVPWNRAEMANVHSGYRMQVQDERWELDDKGEVTVRVSGPYERWM